MDWRILALFGFFIGLRLFYARDTYVDIQGDAAAYVEAAYRFFDSGITGPSSGRPPFYSACLAIFAKLTGFGVGKMWTHVWLNMIFDSVSFYFLLKIGKRIAAGTAIYGIAFVAASPFWFGNINCAVTEPLSVTLFLGFLESWTREKRVRKDEVSAGVFLGLLALTRGIFIFFPPAILVWEWIQPKAPKGARIQGFRRLTFLAGAYALPVFWGFRNLVVTGHFVMTQDDSTAIIMMWCAIKIPTLDWHIREHSDYITSHPWADVLLGRAGPARNTQVFALMHQEVLDFITQHPIQFIQNFFIKLARLWVTGWWDPFSYVYSPPYLSAMYIWSFAIPVLALGSVGLVMQWFGKLAPGENGIAQWRATRIQVLLVLFISAIALPFTVDARYSLPAYVAFGLWLGIGLVQVAAVLSEKRPRRRVSRD